MRVSGSAPKIMGLRQSDLSLDGFVTKPEQLRSGMSKLKRAITIVSLTAVATFGVAACGGDKGGGGGGAKGGEINVTMTSFPDYIDPQLSYTLEGLGGAVEHLHPAADLQARRRATTAPRWCPAWPRSMPEISAGRQDLQAHAAAEHEVLRRHADQGLGLHLRHPAAVQGQLRRLGVLRGHRRRQRISPTARPTPSAASRPTTTPVTSPSRWTEPNGTFNNVLGADVRRAGAAEHAAGQGRDQQPAAVERAVHDHQGRTRRRP